MTEKVYLIPQGGKKVRDIDRGDHLPPEGREVDMQTYWRRRINDGDVTIGKKPAPARKPKSDPADKPAD